MRTEDPEVWSYENVAFRNTETMERLYRGFVRGIRNLSVKDWDMPILVCGREGSGKSAFAINLAVDLDDDVLFHLEDHVLWNAKRDLKMLKNTIKHTPPSVFILDEAGVDLMSRSSMNKDQIELVELFMIMREYNHILILVMPKQRWLDSYLRDHRVALWIQVFWHGSFFQRDRGYCTIRYANHDDFASKPFWDRLFPMRFPDFPIEIKEKYKKLKRHNSLMRNEEEGLSEREQIIVHARSKGKTLQEIGDFIGISHTAVRKTLLKAEKKLKEEESF